jgi:ergothioneine biosynthesis protein EgtB
MPARIAGPDAHFDSARLPHAARWDLALPSRTRVLQMLGEQLDACLQAMPRLDDDAALYFHRLALFHEDMHGEALVWLRASLGYPAPADAALRPQAACAGLAVPRGRIRVGAPAGPHDFAFDNELPGFEVELDAFEIDAQPLTAGQFLRFVEAGGYQNPAFWPGAAGAWRAAERRGHPLRWRRATSSPGESWEVRWFDRWLALDPDLPLIHVNAFEAEAYCLWAGRRLPSAAQWQRAAALPPSDGFSWGDSVWEWTTDAFEPYAGFTPGPYKDYSAPWFGTHRELRGGAFATHARMHATHYRNFFVPQRADVFTGFRTAACEG